jgi:hypothetical protein
MFFKRKKKEAALWWERMQALQRRYARRLADRLNRKFARVPHELKRQYVLFFLIVLTAFNGLVFLRAVGQHWGGKGSPAAPGRQLLRLGAPFRAWRFDDKLYDSLKKERPGLADSLKMLESIY